MLSYRCVDVNDEVCLELTSVINFILTSEKSYIKCGKKTCFIYSYKGNRVHVAADYRHLG